MLILIKLLLISINSRFSRSKQHIFNYSNHVDSTVQDFINTIYSYSWRKRAVQGEYQKFIREKQSLQELYKYYGIRQSEFKCKLSDICNSFRVVRGDGNSFYTAFGFQFFDILLYKHSDSEYNDFIQKTDKIITFKIYYEENLIEDQGHCWNELKQRLQYLRILNDQEELLKHYSAYEQCSDNKLIDGCFYGLATILFRNLTHYLINSNKTLIWEGGCESILDSVEKLSQFLSLNIKLLFLNAGSFTLQEFRSDLQNQIIILVHSDHYNIGYFQKQEESSARNFQSDNKQPLSKEKNYISPYFIQCVNQDYEENQQKIPPQIEAPAYAKLDVQPVHSKIKIGSKIQTIRPN